MKQLGPGTIVHHDNRAYKVLAHYRSNSRHQGYVLTAGGEHLWDKEIKVTSFVPPRVDLPASRKRRPSFFSSLVRKFQRQQANRQ